MEPSGHWTTAYEDFYRWPRSAGRQLVRSSCGLAPGVGNGSSPAQMCPGLLHTLRLHTCMQRRVSATWWRCARGCVLTCVTVISGQADAAASTAEGDLSATHEHEKTLPQAADPGGGLLPTRIPEGDAPRQQKHSAIRLLASRADPDAAAAGARQAEPLHAPAAKRRKRKV